MSQTASRGLVDARRWVGVASSMVDYLQKWENEEAAPPPAPKGIFNAADRFLTNALEGIALNRHQRIQTQIPTMAGISNLTITVGVLTRLPQNPSTLDAVEHIVRAFKACLDQIKENRPKRDVPKKTVDELIQFFRLLQTQGNVARHAAFVESERPPV